jgi:hypothetical protein
MRMQAFSNTQLDNVFCYYTAVYDVNTTSTHSLVLTQATTGTNGVNDNIYVNFVASFSSGDTTYPVAVAGSVSKDWTETNTGYTIGSPDRQIAYNNCIKGNIDLLTSYGMPNLRYVDISNNPIAGFFYADNIHPGDDGQKWIGQQFLKTCQ